MNDLSLNIHITSRLTHNHYARELKKLHLTMGQLPFILGINRTDGISQERLSGELRISKSTTAGIVQQLLGKGFISRETDANDRRNFKLHITETGKALLPKIQQIIDECHNRILQDLPMRERAKFLEQLDRIRVRTEQELTVGRKRSSAPKVS